MKTWKKFRKENINEAETLSWKSLNSNERKDLLKDVRLPSSFSKDSWKDLDYRAKEILGKYINKTTQGEFRIDEAWTPDSVTRNAELGSKKGYGINIKKTGGVTKTPFKHMLLTTRKHGNVRVTFDHGKDEFEGTPQSVALHINQTLGIKESVELDEKIYDPMYYDAGMNNISGMNKFIDAMTKAKITVTSPRKGVAEVFPKEGSDRQKIFKAAERYGMIAVKESVELDEALTLASDDLSAVKKTAQKLARQSPDRTYYVVQNTKIHGDGKMKRYEVVDSVDMHLYRQEKRIIGYGKSVKESVELDEVMSDREMDRFNKAHTALHTRYHKQALLIIKFIDSVEKHKDKWVDSFGDYITPKLPKGLKLSNPNSVEYQQGRGRGNWSFLMGHGKVRYNNSDMPWMPKSGELPFDKFMKLLDTWKKNANKPKSTGGHMGRQTESVELDEKKKPEFKKDDFVQWKGKKGIVVRYDDSGPESPFYVVSFKGKAMSEKIPQHKLEESVDGLDESKMSELHMHIKDGKTAEQIAKIMKIDLKTVKVLMKESKQFNAPRTMLSREEQMKDKKEQWEKAVAMREGKYDTDPRIKKMSDKGKELLAWMANSFEMTGGPHLDKKNVHGLSKFAVDGIVKKLKSLKGLPADKKKDMALVMKELGEGIEEEISTTTTSVGTLTDPLDMGKKKKKKRCTELDKYTDSQIFTVSSEDFNRCSTGRRKNERWSKFFASESEQGANIKKYSLRNPKSPIIIKNEETGDMMFLRRRLNDQRLKHNKRK
jgi:hypothetical protein